MNLVVSLVLFAFCLNGMILSVAVTTNNSELLTKGSTEMLDPENQFGPDGRLTQIITSMESSGSFFGLNLLGDPILALQMVIDIMSGQYLISLAQIVIGFPPMFIDVLGILFGVLNIATFVQIIRGINFGL